MKISSLAMLAGLVAAFAIAEVNTAAAAGFCTLEWKPVCGKANGWRHTYSNACWAKSFKARIVHPGPCK